MNPVPSSFNLLNPFEVPAQIFPHLSSDHRSYQFAFKALGIGWDDSHINLKLLVLDIVHEKAIIRGDPQALLTVCIDR